LQNKPNERTSDEVVSMQPAHSPNLHALPVRNESC
jgi:hypothetical protein